MTSELFRRDLRGLEFFGFCFIFVGFFLNQANRSRTREILILPGLL